MKTTEFYKRLSKELYENTHPDFKQHIKDLKITSLEQVLGIIRSVMMRNNSQIDEVAKMKKELKKLMDVIGISENDL